LQHAAAAGELLASTARRPAMTSPDASVAPLSSSEDAPVLCSARLRLDRLQAADAAFIHALVNSEGWLRFIGDRGVRSLADAEAFIENGPRTSYRVHGFGLWRLSRLEGGPALGVCGLLKRDTLPAPDLGYALLPEFHRHGYAREAAAACIEFAREELQLSELLAICQLDNAASLGLLRGLGFVDAETFRSDNGHTLQKLVLRLR
jgi:ribosomal-protein-alanine N-acetyltransferase